MRILVVTTFYSPDLGPGAALFTMLCEDLVRLGHSVSVIAAVPHYPTGRVPEKFRGRMIRRELQNGVDVTRVWVPSVNRVMLAQRLLTFAVYQVLSTIVGLGRDYNVMLAGNPALEVFLPYLFLAMLRRKPSLFSVHDLYPEVGVKLGIFRHRPVIALVKALEDVCLHQASRVRVLSDGFREAIRARGVPESRIVLIWDWLDTNAITPKPRGNPFSREHGLDRGFVALYAGNIGLSQGLECVLDAAERLSGWREIQFVFVGEGSGKRLLEQEVVRRKLPNVHLFPFQPSEKLPFVLGSADVSLICLKRGISADSVPSKFYSILASARPVVASVDEGSDTWRLIEKAQCGVCVRPEDPDALAGAILNLYQDKSRRETLGANGRSYVTDHHGRAAAAQGFHDAIRSMASDVA